MATTQLRPMALGEILDASFALLRRHAGVFFGIAIVCQGLPTALGLFVQLAGGPQEHFGLYILSQVLSFVGYLLVTGASIRVVSQAYLGHEPSMGDALDFAFSKMGRSFSAGFASGILIGLACLLLLIPGIVVACGLAVAVQAAVLEPLPGGTDGVGRSWKLTSGFKWKAFGLYFVGTVLFLLFILGFGVIAGIAAAIFPPLMVPAVIGLGLISLFLYPFVSCVFTLFYYDLRVRKEAFDLELLSQHLGVAAARA
ncbi:MAG TPA: hypothetical protein VJJ54_01610 [Gemmatimonadales bacterium]|nr:hypothetical protein [Gemmatimonadales bacterium]